MQNKTLIAFARVLLKKLLHELSDGNFTVFKRMYSPNNMDSTIEEAVDAMPTEKLDHALTQAENTYFKLKKEQGKESY